MSKLDSYHAQEHVVELKNEIARLKKVIDSKEQIINNLLAPAKGKTETSKKAAKQIKLSANSMRLTILQHINKTPASCVELEEHLKMKHQTCSARISELKKAGFIEALSVYRIEDHDSNLASTHDVYYITPLGEQELNKVQE